MKLADLILHMYYGQKVRLFLVDYADALKKKLIVEGYNHDLRSDLYKKYYDCEVIGFGVGSEENTIDINLKEEI